MFPNGRWEEKRKSVWWMLRTLPTERRWTAKGSVPGNEVDAGMEGWSWSIPVKRDWESPLPVTIWNLVRIGYARDHSLF